MTYNEFMNWVQTDEELKEKFDRLLGDSITKDGITRILEFYNIYPDRYTNGPFVHGCYKDDNGNWYYYSNNDERTSLTPNGTMDTEEECFKHLKTSLLVEIQHHEEWKRQEAERIANLTPEQKAEREREAKLLRDFHLVQNMFNTENDKAKTINQIKIDLNKIYTAFDDSDEDNESFKTVKEQYIEQFGEEKGIRLLKVFKFITYYGMALQRFGFVLERDSLILQKVNQIFVEMLTEK